MDSARVHRLLVVDDNRAIHEDFRKILCAETADSAIRVAEAELFGNPVELRSDLVFELDSAYQGEEALALMRNSVTAGQPYAIAFVDMEMPPGWDGLETARRLLNEDRHIQIVICTAYSQRSWAEITDVVADSDRLLIIKKPFDIEEILQLAHSLAQRWRLGREAEDLADAHSSKLVHANAELQQQIHERMVAETALGVTEQRLQLALDAANDGLFDWNIRSGSVYFSPRWEKMLGFSPGQVETTTKSIRRLMHPDDRAMTFKLLRSHIEGELGAFEAEYRMRRESGEWVWVLGRGKVVAWSDGKASRLVGTHTDITERKWVEQALVERERQFRTIVSNIPGVVYRRMADETSSIRFISDNVESLFGYPASDFVDNSVRTYASIIHEDDVDAVLGLIDTAIANAEPYSAEYRIICANGDAKWAYERGTVVVDENNRVAYLDGVIFDVTETHALSEQLSYHESRDVLTGLLNRKEFKRELQRAVANSGSDEGNALCYVDLDNFKVVNDSCSQVGGDKLLRDFGRVLRKQLRERDLVARLGGDEFGILLRDCAPEFLEKVTASLCKLADEYRFHWDGKILRTGASVGVVPIDTTTQSVEDLLRIAEAACYVAKDQGRNRAHVYKKDDSVVIRRTGEMQWVSRIYRALEEDRFELWQQPIVPLQEMDGAGLHCEILIRMVTRIGTLVSPGQFLPAAERFHFAKKIDRWVVTNVIDWLAGVPEAAERIQLISINLSGHSLTDHDLCDYIIERVAAAGLDPGKLCFEVTETAAVANLRSARRFLEQLRDFGCKSALDDFGTGLSSFGYLTSLPVDYLKIDGMFIRDILDNPVHAGMVRAINDVGQLMGKRTIAEFVESDEAAGLLSEIGLDYGQGYGLGRPRPVSEIFDGPKT